MAAPSLARLLAVTLLCALLRSASAKMAPCAHFGGVKRVALLVADPGSFSGSAEEKYFSENLKSSHAIGSNETVCGGKSFGVIMGQPVVLVTTGIGPLTAALCVTELLKCRPYIASVVYAGTSGWSAQVGGVLNAEGAPNPSRKVTRIGDLCVSPFAINWECQQTDWTQQCKGFPNVDSYPQDIFGPAASFLYGQCIFTSATRASVVLARQLYRAAMSAMAFSSRPKRSKAVLYNEKIYFGNMSAGTGVRYRYDYPDARNTAYDHQTCSEADGQFFYSGVPWDMSARNFTALLLNEVWKGKKRFTQKNVIAVSAMEAIGVAMAIQQYNSFARKKVPYTIIRGNSNWLHAPVYKTKDGKWRQITQSRDFASGYAYAIASYSNAVLTWLRSRCISQIKAGELKGSASVLCQFTLSYTG